MLSQLTREVCGLAACLVAAVALLCWPSPSALARLRWLASAGRPARRWPTRRQLGPGITITAAALTGAAVGWSIARAGGAAGLALVAVTVAWRTHSRRASSVDLAAAADLVAALGLLTAELRAGVHPAVAAQRVAGDTSQPVAGVLAVIADAARLSGDVPDAVRRAAETAPALAGPAGRVAAAWQLSERHGVGLAEVLDAVRRDLDHRVKATRRLAAALAGPRATSMVLAGLPLLGLVLGQAVGADPWRVLAGTAAGQVLLLAGCGLVCAGLVWSAHLTARAAAP